MFLQALTRRRKGKGLENYKRNTFKEGADLLGAMELTLVLEQILRRLDLLLLVTLGIAGYRALAGSS